MANDKNSSAMSHLVWGVTGTVFGVIITYGQIVQDKRESVLWDLLGIAMLIWGVVSLIIGIVRISKSQSD